MTIHPIRLLGDPVLRTPCDLVTRFDDALSVLVRDLLEGVQLPGRAGLAAPQVGVGLAVFAYDVDGHLGYVVNPRVVRTSGVQSSPEGCLSLPGISADTPRAAYAVIAGEDRHGRPVTVEGEGELARCLQHEVDHLDGVLYVDRLEGDGRRRVLREIRELQR
jgi:peptide deformylase